MDDLRTYEDVTSEILCNDKEAARLYLETSIEEYEKTDNLENLLYSLGIVAKAKGFTAFEKEIGLSRRALYTALSHDGNPKIKNFQNILKPLGCTLSIRMQ